jgi:glutathione synthase
VSTPSTQLKENQIKGSSTTEIVNVGIERGYELHVADPTTISKSTGEKIIVKSRCVVSAQITTNEKQHSSVLEEELYTEIERYSAVLMRIQPPFDISYAITCSLLVEISDKVLFINSPRGILMIQEKIFPLSYPGLHPKTLISSDLEQITEFIRDNRMAVLKPVNNYQGNGVEKFIWDKNIAEKVGAFLTLNGTPIIAQAFIDGIANGDKRILLLDGKPIGAINRIPPKGSFIANTHSGGKAFVADINERDIEIASLIAPELRANGLYFVGLDVIDGFLTEIGTTSPAGIMRYRKLTGYSLADVFWDWIDKKIEEGYS